MDASIENAQRYNPFVNNSEYFNFGIVQAIRQPAIKPTSTTWERFCKALESPKIRDQKDGPGAVFATFSKQWRNRENVLTVTALAYDLEQQAGGPAIPAPAAIAEDLRGLGLAFAVWTTFSDRPEARRIRVVLPIEDGLAPELLRAAYPLPLKYLPIVTPDMLDATCAEPARMMILPAIPADRRDQYECYCSTSGDWLQGSSLALAATTVLQQQKDAAQAKQARFRPGPLSGRESVIEAFNREHPVEEILECAGYKQRGKKWVSPNSHSGQAGVIVRNGKAFSHHSDALGDHFWHDSFDLYAKLHHGGDKRLAAQSLRGGRI
ncbi:hypothetical protein HF292_003550 [Acidithiobacillus ferruginosus]|uniref:Uncharacterized protein n=1 Tax=Acidithiobacillus ferruginosus TaxID=3063951 RepID=A0ACD5IJR4_9PROT|nr:hypothetical protein [Acidithiobacillus ferruginosus]MBU2815350.1 hypothetical protein [Acidithiobacillus ferruginosus]